MNGKYIRNQKGAISLFVMLSMLFFLVFILGIYTMTSVKNRAQVESLSQVKSMYKQDADNIYDSKIASKEEVIPIYTKDQLDKVGSGKIFEIDGKMYTFKEGTSSANPVNYIIKAPIYVSINYKVPEVDYGIVDENDNLIRLSDYITDNNKTVNGETGAYNNPTIPVGFKPVNTPDASWEELETDWNKGLVIEDQEGNQFVWVPIDGVNVTYTKWCTSGISYNDSELDRIILEIPAIDKSTTYGGFWIGRYEVGIPEGNHLENTINRNNITITDAVSKPGRVPWNNISYTNAKTVSERLHRSSHVQSALVNGVQYDTVMKWIQSSGYNVSSDSSSWGNYNNSSIILNNSEFISTDGGVNWNNANSTTSGTSQIVRTGASESTKVKNIYDLAGNMWEWTDESYDAQRIRRGRKF